MIAANVPTGRVPVTPAPDEAALAALMASAPQEVADFLTRHSGLPGSRANLPLADAFAALAPADLVRTLAESTDEYLAFCGTEGLGRLLLDTPEHADVLAALRRAAADKRWRVREGAARGLQLVGDTDPPLMHAIVEEWASSQNLWLARAAVAAICEPRLLHSAQAQSVALRVCDLATTLLLQRAPASPDPVVAREAHRVLRQALGYGWSVAIAADPNAGLTLFRRLAALDDPDARWIVRSNHTKARLRSVLADRNFWGALG